MSWFWHEFAFFCWFYELSLHVLVNVNRCWTFSMASIAYIVWVKFWSFVKKTFNHLSVLIMGALVQHSFALGRAVLALEWPRALCWSSSQTVILLRRTSAGYISHTILLRRNISSGGRAHSGSGIQLLLRLFSVPFASNCHPHHHVRECVVA